MFKRLKELLVDKGIEDAKKVWKAAKNGKPWVKAGLATAAVVVVVVPFAMTVIFAGYSVGLVMRGRRDAKKKKLQEKKESICAKKDRQSAKDKLKECARGRESIYENMIVNRFI